ncbi:MAG: hypothetical protein LBK65_10530 [Tannerellaceae bacterium]|nr:hypothetical protein [Tannerellaceae bacterium]
MKKDDTNQEKQTNGEISDEEKMQAQLDNYSTFFSRAFVDIATVYARENVNLFFELFHNRIQELMEFKTVAENMYTTGDNILFIGHAGVGKSNFIHRLFYDTPMLEKYKLYPTMIDFRTIPTDDKLLGVKMKFIAVMTEYFDKMDFSISSQVDNKIANINNNLFIIQESFEKLIKEGKKSKQPLVFVDDLDYAEKDELFPILQFLKPYAHGKNISIFMCVRPPLCNTIIRNDGTYANLFVHTPKNIKARSMELHSILATRLAPILLVPETTPKDGVFEYLIDRLKLLRSKNKPYRKLLEKLGVKNLDNLVSIKYPFTDEYVVFMRKISLEDLREIFIIAIRSLNFIIKNYKNLAGEDESGRKVIPRKDIIKMFLADPDDDHSDNDQNHYHFFNLHKYKNSRGNSLYLNVLEAMQIYRDNRDPRFKEQLNDVGHTDEKIEYALRIMARKRHRLLLSYDFTYAKDNADELFRMSENTYVTAVQYKISDKGLYYLKDISKWPEYIEEYGSSKVSIMTKVYGPYIGNEAKMKNKDENK